MWFLPFDLAKIKSNLSIDQILRNLSDIIDLKAFLALRLAPPPNHKPFRGSFSAKGFTIIRWIHYKNPFLPLIIGRIASDNTIYITMIPHPFGILVGIFILQLPFFWLDKQPLQLAATFFVYIFILLAYKGEAVHAMDIFKGKFK